MKVLLTVFALIMAVNTSSCQEKKHKKDKGDDNVPEVVVKAFKAKYPNEKVPEFKTDAHGYWEAHFKKKGEKYRADFNENGTWRETENSIKVSELPEPIQSKINSTYFLYTITEVEHVLSAKYGEFYDVEFKQKGKNKDIMFKKDGSIIEE